jgi:hypothetical protein
MRSELEHRFHDKMGRYTHAREKRQHANERRGRDDNKKQVASSTSYGGRYDTNRRPEKDSRGDRKAPPEQKDKDFKPCHVHGIESKHSYDECSRNPKNAKTTNKSSYYVKKRGNDAHYSDNHCYSSGDDPPTSECNTPVPSNGEVENKSSSDEKSNSNYHIECTPKKRKVSEKNGVGHKSLTQKKSKTLVEPDSGIKKIPKKNRISNTDGDLNFYDTNDVMSDDAKSCLSINDDNGLSFADFDDAFGFKN